VSILDFFKNRNPQSISTLKETYLDPTFILIICTQSANYCCQTIVLILSYETCYEYVVFELSCLTLYCVHVGVLDGVRGILGSFAHVSLEDALILQLKKD
jgi:hypothetical protein